jgi:hypothetical protein
VRSILAVAHGRWRQRDLGGSLALWSRPTKGRSGGGQDASRLGPHAEHAPAAWGKDLKVQFVEAHAELLAGGAKRFLDGLAGELAVCVAKSSHVSVVSLSGSPAGAG